MVEPGTRSDARLPVLLGVLAHGAWPAGGATLARALRQEFLRLAARCPSSPLVVVADVDRALLPVIHEAAANAGVPCQEARHPGAPAAGGSPASPVAGIRVQRACHVLISCRCEGAGAPDAPRPQETDIELERPDGIERVELVCSGIGASEPDAPNVGWRRSAQSAPRTGAKRFAADETERYNRDVLALRSRHSRAADSAAPGAAIIDGDAGADGSGALVFAHSDALAGLFQARVRWTLWAIFLLSQLAAVLFGAFLTLGSADPVLQQSLLGPYVAFLSLAYALYIVAGRSRIHERFVEYRALAEGMRVRLHWRACGVEAGTLDPDRGDLALPRAWLQLALRSHDMPLWGRAPTRPTADPARALQHWVADQRKYFRSSLRRARRLARRIERGVGLVFLAGAGATLVVLFHAQLPVAPYLRFISLASFLGPLLGGGIVAFVNRIGLNYQAAHYGRMLDIFEAAAGWLERPAVVEVAALARALGIEALRENRNWVAFRLERVIDEPAGPFRRPR